MGVPVSSDGGTGQTSCFVALSSSAVGRVSAVGEEAADSMATDRGARIATARALPPAWAWGWNAGEPGVRFFWCRSSSASLGGTDCPFPKKIAPEEQNGSWSQFRHPASSTLTSLRHRELHRALLLLGSAGGVPREPAPH